VLDKRNLTHNNQELKLKPETTELMSMIISLPTKEKIPKITRVIESKDQIKISLITKLTIKRVELVECNLFNYLVLNPRRAEVEEVELGISKIN
jgi:hypothetical protein